MSADAPESTSARPEVAQIRPAELTDLPAVARVHLASFPGFFLTALGPAVLRAYYRLVLEYEQGVLLVAESRAGLAGFAAGFVDPAAFYRRMAARKWRFAWLVLIRLVTRPTLLPSLLAKRQRLARPAPLSQSSRKDSCELASLAVHPAHAGQGLGKELVRAFLDVARRRKAAHVYLTTDARHNEAVNAIYQRLKFRLARTFEAPGRRLMNEYVLSIQAEAADPRGST